MKERIILAPGLNGSELRRNLALYGVNCFNTRIFGSGAFARYVLMRSGVSITEEFIDFKEENSIIAEAIKDEGYFAKASYADIQTIAGAIRRLRSLVVSDNEDESLEEKLSKGFFTDKNNALISVYKKYKKSITDQNKIDAVGLTRKALENCVAFDAEFCIIDGFPISPLDKKLIAKVSDDAYKTITLSELYEVSDTSLKIEFIRNCYGAPNEVEMIISDIYSEKNKLDHCTVAITDVSTYAQLFFDYALLYNIPLTFGCGLPIINSNPARLLSLYNAWMTSGFFGKEAIIRMVKSDCFNKKVLKEVLSEIKEEIDWKTLYRYLGQIKLTNRHADNERILTAYKKAIEEEKKYIVPGESKEYKDFIKKQECIPLLERMATELELTTEEFIYKYSYLRQGDKTISQQIASSLDIASRSAIFEELKAVRKSGASQTEGEIIIGILKMNVLNQSSKPGYIHITTIDKSLCSIRKNLYIAGLSSSMYPGSPKENHLLLDDDIEQFDADAEYLLSANRVIRKRKALMNLTKIASGLGSKISLSYAGLNVSELKHQNASSMIYELYDAANGGNVTAKKLDEATIKVGYFEPAISDSRLIGSAYIDKKIIEQNGFRYKHPKAVWKLEKKYSPTEIDNFFGCPRSFMLNYILRITEPDEDKVFEVIPDNDVGTLSHLLMEQLTNSSMTLDEFCKLSEEFFDHYIDQHPPLIASRVASERSAFLELMTNAYTMNKEECDKNPGMKVILGEKDVECTHSSGVELHGYPDRVEQLSDGSLVIVDFKTGRTVKHQKDDIKTCLQVVVYAYLMESLGYKISHCEYWYPRRRERVTCKYDDEMKEKLSLALKEFKKKMENGDFPCGLACDYCKYGEICKKELEEELYTFGFGEESV